jgi:hypothetical protein
MRPHQQCAHEGKLSTSKLSASADLQLHAKKYGTKAYRTVHRKLCKEQPFWLPIFLHCSTLPGSNPCDMHDCKHDHHSTKLLTDIIASQRSQLCADASERSCPLAKREIRMGARAIGAQEPAPPLLCLTARCIYNAGAFDGYVASVPILVPICHCVLEHAEARSKQPCKSLGEPTPLQDLKQHTWLQWIRQHCNPLSLRGARVGRSCFDVLVTSTCRQCTRTL